MYSSFFAFHFDFTGGKGVGKSSLVRRFLVGASPDRELFNQSETPFFYFF